ncbi:MAG: transposase [Polaromonas sp.]|nr:transposase [Polaromonas sp.]
MWGADSHTDARLAITDVFERNHRCYGYRRIRAALSRQKLCFSKKVVQRLMKQERLVVAATKWRRYGCSLRYGQIEYPVLPFF